MDAQVPSQSAHERFKAQKDKHYGTAKPFRGRLPDFDASNFYNDDDYYYEYICTYVDDILALSEDPDAIMRTISETYTLKDVKGTGEKWETPTSYLGADVDFIDKTRFG